MGRTQKISAAWGAILGMHIGGPVTRAFVSMGEKYQGSQIDDQTCEDDIQKLRTDTSHDEGNNIIIC